jgi:hypothetical protein
MIGLFADSRFEQLLNEHIQRLRSQRHSGHFSDEGVSAAINSGSFAPMSGIRWFPLSSLESPWRPRTVEERNQFQHAVQKFPMVQLWTALMGNSGTITPGKLELTLLRIGQLPLPLIHFIEHTRKWGKATFSDALFDGSDLVDRLAKLQQADKTEDSQSPRKWAALLQFFKEITGQADADIHIPYENDKVNVFLNGHWLDLDELGTGIHEIVILAALCVIQSKCAICIEEPELHQHPRLQRKLL